MARNRKGHPYCDVTTIRQPRYFRSDNVRFQDGVAVDIGKQGRGALSSDYSFFLSMSALAQVHVVIMHTHRTTVLLCCSGLFDIRVHFLYDSCNCAWRIEPIRFNNVSLCSLIFIPTMSGLLCPLLLNPGRRFVSWMRVYHYTTRASRNEFSNVGAIEVGLYATQVPNYCRKWHNIYILVIIHSPLYMSHTILR